MRETVTSAQMRAIEQAAIASGSVTGRDLMERAGRGVVEALFAEWPELAAEPRRALVLCGPGNNGGDGFVVARLLADWGWGVEVFLYGDPDRLPPDARANHDRWRAQHAVGGLDDLMARLRPPPGARGAAAILVDALFGTGLTRPLPDRLHGLARTLEDARQRSAGAPRVLAIDMPSGLCGDSGRVLGRTAGPNPGGAVLSADLTVTFHRAKTGQFLQDGPRACGRLRLADIGLPGESDPATDRVRLADETAMTGLAKGPGAHKYSHGHALILTGGAGHTGAARLAARGALRVGAGVVTLGVPDAAQAEVAGHVTAIMQRRIDDASDLAAALGDTRINAVCLGPGLGLDGSRAAILATAMAQARGRGLVIDADALGLLAGDAALFAALPGGSVLTPHGGEFARLFPDLAEALAGDPLKGPGFSKVDATRAAARRAGSVVLFKGADTVIAAPDGRCAINAAVYDRAAPWLATAGAGDVLAGFIAGLMARGVAPFEAAVQAAWLHAECARAFGPGLIAEDLPEALPGVLRGLGG